VDHYLTMEKNMRKNQYYPHNNRVSICNYGLSDKNIQKNGKIYRRATDIISEIVLHHVLDNRIIRINGEEEIAILHDLYDSGMLSKFCVIMIEWRKQNEQDKQQLIKLLGVCGFSYCWFAKSMESGLIYAFNGNTGDV